MLRVHFAQIEGDLLLHGTDPWSLTVRQMISVAESWFLAFFEPAQWSEVTEKLEGITAQESTAIFTPEGAPISVSRQAMNDMADLLAASRATPPPQPSDSTEADSQDRP